MSKTMKGTLMTLIAGIAWGLSGVSGQYLMVHGFSAIELTNLRSTPEEARSTAFSSFLSTRCYPTPENAMAAQA